MTPEAKELVERLRTNPLWPTGAVQSLTAEAKDFIIEQDAIITQKDARIAELERERDELKYLMGEMEAGNKIVDQRLEAAEARVAELEAVLTMIEVLGPGNSLPDAQHLARSVLGGKNGR